MSVTTTIFDMQNRLIEQILNFVMDAKYAINVRRDSESYRFMQNDFQLMVLFRTRSSTHLSNARSMVSTIPSLSSSVKPETLGITACNTVVVQ